MAEIVPTIQALEPSALSNEGDERSVILALDGLKCETCGGTMGCR
jgi:hypothetical protein